MRFNRRRTKGCLVLPQQHPPESGSIEAPDNNTRLQPRFVAPCERKLAAGLGSWTSLDALCPRQHVRASVDPAKYYYFYISWSREQHRFSTSIWRMLVLLGSWRHRGND